MINRKFRSIMRELGIAMSAVMFLSSAGPAAYAGETETGQVAGVAAESETQVQAAEVPARDTGAQAASGTAAAQETPKAAQEEPQEAPAPAAEETPAPTPAPQETAETSPQTEAPKEETTETAAPAQTETKAPETGEAPDTEKGQTEGGGGQSETQAEQQGQETEASKGEENSKAESETEKKTETGENKEAAETEDAASQAKADASTEASEHVVTITGGESADGTTVYKTGDTVHIKAIVPSGNEFSQWSADKDTVKFLNGSENSAEASFIMPDEDVAVTAHFKETHKIMLTNGTAQVNSKTVSEAKAGDKVFIYADSIIGKKFAGWKVESGDAKIANTSYRESSFTMPEGDVTISATYEDISIAAPALSLNTSTADLLVGNDIELSMSNLSVSGAERAVWQIDFPDYVYFHRFVSGVSFASGSADLKVEVKEKGSSGWSVVSDVPNYEGRAQSIRITLTSKTMDNDVEAALNTIRFYLEASRPFDPNDAASSGDITAYLRAYTVKEKELSGKVESNSPSKAESSNSLVLPIGYKLSTGPDIVCNKPTGNAVGSTFTTTLSGFSGPNVQKAVITYTIPENVRLYSIEKTPAFSESATTIEYRDASGNWNAYSDGADKNRMSAIRFIGTNSEYGVTQESDAVLAFKGIAQGSGSIRVHTSTDRFGVEESFDTSCSYEIEESYINQNMSCDNYAPDTEDTVTETVNVSLLNDLEGVTVHYAPDAELSAKTFTPVAGLDSATVTITYAGGTTAAMAASSAIDLSGYEKIRDIAIMPADTEKGRNIAFTVSLGIANERAVSATNRITTEVRNGRDVIRYSDSESLKISRCIVQNPSLAYSGGEVPFDGEATVHLGGLSLSATQTSSDYTCTVNTPDFLPLKSITLPVLSDGSKMHVKVIGESDTDLGEMDGGSEVSIGQKVSKVILTVSGSKEFTTKTQGAFVFSNNVKENKTNFFKVSATNSVAYRSAEEIRSKSFESSGIALKLYKDDKDADDPDIKPIENEGSNKGTVEETEKAKEPEEELEEETEKKTDNSKARKAQEKAQERSREREDIRSRIAKIRENMLNRAAVVKRGFSGAYGMEESTGETNEERISNIKKKEKDDSGKLAKKRLIKSMLLTDQLKAAYVRFGLYPIPESIVSYNKKALEGMAFLKYLRMTGVLAPGSTDEKTNTGLNRAEGTQTHSISRTAQGSGETTSKHAVA